ncbi:DotA/TraY family protein, partial [Escherichia coli]|nr:DotA/TraY family protein [Escherichia coli]
MKIIPRALSAGLALAAVPAQAFVTYQDIVSAATNPDDLSRQALVTIFGDVVTNPLTASSNTIIGNLFMVFNAIIAIMGIVWFLFIGIRHVVRTGHQGNVFNNGRDVVGMLSIVSGFMMIVPTASGWSLAQLVMLWGASIMGIGSANIMVQTAAENIAEGYSMTVQPVHVSTRTAARGILEMALCKHAMNAGLDDFNRTARSSTPPMSESSRTENGRYTVTVSNGSATCGSVSLTVKGNGSNNQSALDYFFNPFIETEYQGVLTAQRSAMDTMLRDLDSAAQEFVSAYRTRRDTGNGNLPDIESRIQKAANRYEETVQKALPTDNAETERREQLKSYLTTYGWVALGAWYQTFATANQRLAELA